MPIKWTPENDKLLLYKILETSSVSADTKAISAAWPTTNGEVPTPRAISERLCKIRASVKANGGAHFSVTSSAKPKAATNNTTQRTPTATPRKPRAKKAGSELTVTSENGDGPATKSGKRKRGSGNASSNASPSARGSQTTSGNGQGGIANGNGVAVKMEITEEAEHEANGNFNGISPIEGLYDDDEESSSKRTKTLTVTAEDGADAEGDGDADDDGDYKFLEHLV